MTDEPGASRKYLVLGGGVIGTAVAYDLLRCDDAECVTVVDCSHKRLEEVVATTQPNTPETYPTALRTVYENLNDHFLGNVAKLIGEHDVIVSALPSELDEIIAHACIEKGRDACFLGGSDDALAALVALGDRAAEAGVRIIPCAGAAPGALNVLARLACDTVAQTGVRPDALIVRAGAVPVDPTAARNAFRGLTARSFVRGCAEPVTVGRDGALRTVVPLEQPAPSWYGDVLGTLEEVPFAGGLGTLARTYGLDVADVDFRAVGRAEQWTFMRSLAALGFLDSRADRLVCGLTPRQVTEKLLAEHLPSAESAFVARVAAKAFRGREAHIALIVTDDHARGLTAQQRVVGCSASIMAQMLAKGNEHVLPVGGVLAPEVHVPADVFIAEWRKRGIEPGFVVREHPSTTAVPTAGAAP